MAFFLLASAPGLILPGCAGTPESADASPYARYSCAELIAERDDLSITLAHSYREDDKARRRGSLTITDGSMPKMSVDYASFYWATKYRDTLDLVRAEIERKHCRVVNT